MPEGLRLALTTFTVLPSRAAQVDRKTAGRAMLWSPIVGAGIAVVAGIVLQSKHILPPTVVSVLTVITLALITRGLHLDGLADTVDGLASHKPAEQALAIMSDGPVGALGAAALVLCLLADTIALDISTQAGRGFQALSVAVVTGRLAMVQACTPPTPAARPGGMGALVAQTVPRSAALGWTVAVGLGAFLFGAIEPGTWSGGGSVCAVAAVLAGSGVALIVRVHAVRRLGGITGDVLGALCEIATTVALVVMTVR